MLTGRPCVALKKATGVVNPIMEESAWCTGGSGPYGDLCPGLRGALDSPEGCYRGKLGDPKQEERATSHGKNQHDQGLEMSMLMSNSTSRHAFLPVG